MRRELTTEQQLFAENRAFALRDNFEILEDELKRLALLPQMNLGDDDLLPEQQLLLGRAPELGPLQHGGVAADRGRRVRALGPRPARVPRAELRRPAWFKAARGGAPGPLFRVTDEPDIGRTLKIVQPLMRDKKLRGRAGRASSRWRRTTSSRPRCTTTCRSDTDAMLVDTSGQIIYPPDRERAAGVGLGGAIAAAAAARAEH